jgi:hypothetical protein
VIIFGYDVMIRILSLGQMAPSLAAGLRRFTANCIVLHGRPFLPRVNRRIVQAISRCGIEIAQAIVGTIDQWPKLVPYAGRFDSFHVVQAMVSKTCLVRFDNNKYSVAASAVRRQDGCPPPTVWRLD